MLAIHFDDFHSPSHALIDLSTVESVLQRRRGVIVNDLDFWGTSNSLRPTAIEYSAIASFVRLKVHPENQEFSARDISRFAVPIFKVPAASKSASSSHAYQPATGFST